MKMDVKDIQKQESVILEVCVHGEKALPFTLIQITILQSEKTFTKTGILAHSLTKIYSLKMLRCSEKANMILKQSGFHCEKPFFFQHQEHLIWPGV